jgi:hypothetical protein
MNPCINCRRYVEGHIFQSTRTAAKEVIAKKLLPLQVSKLISLIRPQGELILNRNVDKELFSIMFANK